MPGTSIFFLFMELGLAARPLGCMLDMYSRDFRHPGTAGLSSRTRSVDSEGETSMKNPLAAVLVVPLALACLAAAAAGVNFDDLPVGTAPAGWTGTKTGTGNPKWT